MGPDACRSTQHCAYHGWCHRCDPEFAKLMSAANAVIQRSVKELSSWGKMYAEMALELRPVFHRREQS